MTESANSPEPALPGPGDESNRLADRELRMSQIRASIDEERDALVGRTDYDQMTFSELAAASEDALSYGVTRAMDTRRMYVDELVARKKAEFAPQAWILWIFLALGGASLVGAVALTFGSTPSDPSGARAFVIARAFMWILAGVVGATLLSSPLDPLAPRRQACRLLKPELIGARQSSRRQPGLAHAERLECVPGGGRRTVESTLKLNGTSFRSKTGREM